MNPPSPLCTMIIHTNLKFNRMIFMIQNRITSLCVLIGRASVVFAIPWVIFLNSAPTAWVHWKHRRSHTPHHHNIGTDSTIRSCKDIIHHAQGPHSCISPLHAMHLDFMVKQVNRDRLHPAMVPLDIRKENNSLKRIFATAQVGSHFKSRYQKRKYICCRIQISKNVSSQKQFW